MSEVESAGSDVGFIGLGNMGRHMARRLVESGRRLIVFDINPSACEEARALNMVVAPSPRAVADAADVVLTSLPTPAVVQEVLVGKDGIIEGSVVETVIDLSTIGPQLAGRNAVALKDRGISLVDAPVSGGTTGAAAGTLAIMLSGPAGSVERAMPLLNVLGRMIIPVGNEPGQAQTVKLINNMLFSAHLIAALEGMAMGVRCGVDPQRLLDVINASSGRSFITETRIGPNVLHRDDQVRFATGLLHKDVALGVREADAAGAHLQLFHASQAFLGKAIEEGFGERDYAALIEIFEQLNGVAVRVDTKEMTQ